MCLDRTYFAETENRKHCSKIIFKYVNNDVGPIFNEKLIKNEICRFINSIYMHGLLQKVNICGYCSLNSNRNTPRRVKKKKKKNTKQNKTKQNKTQLGNTDLESKRTLYSWSWTCKENQIGYFFPLFSIQ